MQNMFPMSAEWCLWPSHSILAQRSCHWELSVLPLCATHLPPYHDRFLHLLFCLLYQQHGILFSIYRRHDRLMHRLGIGVRFAVDYLPSFQPLPFSQPIRFHPLYGRVLHLPALWCVSPLTSSFLSCLCHPHDSYVCIPVIPGPQICIAIYLAIDCLSTFQPLPSSWSVRLHPLHGRTPHLHRGALCHGWGQDSPIQGPSQGLCPEGHGHQRH